MMEEHKGVSSIMMQEHHGGGSIFICSSMMFLPDVSLPHSVLKKILLHVSPRRATPRMATWDKLAGMALWKLIEPANGRENDATGHEYIGLDHGCVVPDP